MLRRGEICGGRWTGVDFGNQIYKVSHTRVVTGGKVLDQETPKSDSSERDLPMSGMLDEALRRAREQQAADKAKWGDEYNDSGFIVVDEKGNPLHPEDFTYFWYCLLRSCGLPEIRLHDARHSLATILIRKGVDPAVVSAWLGLARVSFTMDTYVHTNPEDLRPAAKTLDRVVTFSDIKPSRGTSAKILTEDITPDQAAETWVPPAGFEPATFRSGGERSIP